MINNQGHYKLSPRAQLKQVQSDLQAKKRRISFLKRKQQRQKQSIINFKKRAQSLLDYKISISERGELIEKEQSSSLTQSIKLEELKLNNKQKKQSQQKILDTILKAVFLVKLDDAREIKNISKKHKKVVEQIKQKDLQLSREKKAQQYKDQQFRRLKQIRFIKEKFTKILEERSKSNMQTKIMKKKTEGKLDELNNQQRQLINQLNQISTEKFSAKKQYFVAKGLPMRDIAMFFEERDKQELRKSITTSKMKNYGQAKDKINIDAKKNLQIKMPNTNLEDSKLRIVLQQLKKTKNQASRDLI